MKLLIASDIHGAARCTHQLFDRLHEEQPDSLVLLGDLLYHGPRNALPNDYDPQTVASLLNACPVPIVAVRGNCDAEVDQMLLDFSCMDTSARIVDGARALLLSHGHVITPDDHPAIPFPGALVTGHTHVKTLEKRGNVLYVNPGSVSIPKDGSHSYATYEDGTFQLKQLKNGEILAEATL